MFRGFYQLTSGMLSQGRRLDVIANNMTNVSTAGYKADRYTDSTAFREVMLSRVGNKDKVNTEEIGPYAYILAPDQLYTDYTQGSLEETELPLDFAIEGDGFFAIEWNGQVAYTRAGSFNLDDEGYLALPSVGRVIGKNGQIRIGTDKIDIDSYGRIRSEDGRTNYGQIAVVDFNNYDNLEKGGNGVFYTNEQATATNGQMLWKYLERSNVNAVQEMVNMMSSQRALQSASQVLKMYDQIMGKAVTEIGRV